ncbi:MULTISPECIES: FhaA domain-containing protein [Aestuariimicrobium]|uniref:FhaA domain-containing protein n=1 Tax=Aestuariimicrobium TaxID=396388 RepID=UPI0003B39B29|nr:MULTISPECIES: DUF3662 and FHA domain-containing protein [Aestuariimicrobium]
MGLLDKIEQKIEGAVNGVFARAFKGDVEPVEIAARLQRELDARATVLSREKRLVPNHFVVGLSSRDHDRLAPYSKTLNAEIIPELREHAGERRYVFNGPIVIEYELDETLPTGRFTVESQASAGVERGQAALDADDDHTHVFGATPRLVLEVNGVRHPLMAPGLLIGRGSEADLRINDPGISRKHAMIHVSGPDISIEDLGSTNGITVNGQKCRQAQITDGTRLEIGTTRMLVHAPVGS